MSETKFTPEPWHCPETNPIAIFDSKGRHIAVFGMGVEIGLEESLANAMLAKSAPAMYELLEQVAEICLQTDNPWLSRRIEPILAAARGEANQSNPQP